MLRCLVSFLVLCAALPAGATSVVPPTRASLSARADSVVRARVLSLRPERSAVSGRPLTVSRLQVLESYRGALAGEFELEQLGGGAGGASLVVPGDAVLTEGEEAVLFLRCAGLPRCRIVGLSLGKYALRGSGTQRLAVREAPGLTDTSGRPIEADVVSLQVLARELKEQR